MEDHSEDMLGYKIRWCSWNIKKSIIPVKIVNNKITEYKCYGGIAGFSKGELYTQYKYSILEGVDITKTKPKSWYYVGAMPEYLQIKILISEANKGRQSANKLLDLYSDKFRIENGVYIVGQKSGESDDSR